LIKSLREKTEIIFTMAAVSMITLKEAIIPLQCSFDADNTRTIKVEHKWGNNNENYGKMHLPICGDPSKKELFLYVIDQFIDAAHEDRLHLTSGPVLYTKFRMVLDGALRLAWQSISDDRNQRTVESFKTDTTKLVDKYLSPSSFEDQKEYLNNVVKPFSITCENLGARLEVINRLSTLLPGSEGGRVYPTILSMKRAYFKMMPQAWKIEFIKSTNKLDQDDYQFQDLVRYMSVMESLDKRGVKRRNDSDNNNGGRGSNRNNRGNQRRNNSRGGFSFGRSSYNNRGGRGFPGRTAHPSYFGPPRQPYSNYPTNTGTNPSMYRTPVPYQSPTGRGNPMSRSSPSGRVNVPFRGGRGSGRSGRGGRGSTPYLPSFMVDNPQPQDHYHDTYAQDTYFHSDTFFDSSVQEHEQYYQEHQQPIHEEQYYHENNEEHHAYDQYQEDPNEVNWMEDFGEY